MPLPVLLMILATVLGGNTRTLTVQCNVRADPGVDGYVYLGTGPIHLRPEHCKALSKPYNGPGSAYAALTLGHELGHYVLNTRDEQRAECYGLKLVPEIARILHWPAGRTLRSARYQSFCGS